MAERMATIADAQRSRGMETGRSLLTRMRALLPLISPVVVSSFIGTKERVIALETRGFNAKNRKTSLSEQHTITLDRVVQGFLVLSIVGVIGWKIMTWLRQK